jgi:lactoylglutathione lyase
MKYLHTMVRVTDLEASLRFYRDALGLTEVSRKEFPQGRFTLVFLAAPGGRNFGHVAYAVEDIYALCRRLMDHGVTINRPPRDGHMAFVRSPDDISVELLQQGSPLPPAEPWKSMPNVGQW